MRIGLIGCGSYGRHIASKIRLCERVDLVACHDPHAANARHLAEREGAEAVGSLDDLLARNDIEGVFIVTPNATHHDIAIAAIHAGKHLFVEKPLANTIDEAERIVDAATQNGRILLVGHNGRRRPAHRMMRRLIDEGKIGRIITAEANFSRNGVAELTRASWRFSPEQCPLLPLTQLGVHHIDTLRYLLGEVAEVHTAANRFTITGDNVDNTITTLRFASGTLASLVSSYASVTAYHIRLNGETGYLHCENGTQLLLKVKANESLQELAVPATDDIIEQVDEFAACVRGKQEPEVSGKEALATVEILEAAILSNSNGTPVPIRHVHEKTHTL